MGVASYEKLVKARPFIIVGAFVLAAIFTPPDVLSQLLLAIPLVVLFEVGLLCVRMFGRRDEGNDDDDEEES